MRNPPRLTVLALACTATAFASEAAPGIGSRPAPYRAQAPAYAADREARQC